MEVVVVEVSGVVVVVVVLVVDVVVEVVVDVTTVTAVLSMGHDEVAAVGRICKGLIFSGTDVVVDDSPGTATTVVEVSVGASVIGVIASVSDSAGATAGGSL